MKICTTLSDLIPLIAIIVAFSMVLGAILLAIIQEIWKRAKKEKYFTGI